MSNLDQLFEYLSYDSSLLDQVLGTFTGLEAHIVTCLDGGELLVRQEDPLLNVTPVCLEQELEQLIGRGLATVNDGVNPLQKRELRHKLGRIHGVRSKRTLGGGSLPLRELQYHLEFFFKGNLHLLLRQVVLVHELFMIYLLRSMAVASRLVGIPRRPDDPIGLAVVVVLISKLTGIF